MASVASRTEGGQEERVERGSVSSAEPDGAIAVDARRRWLTRGVGSVGLASFFSDSGHEIATSILPSFVTHTLRSSAGALGLIEGLSDALTGVAKLIGGPLANDESRRLRLATGGYLVTAAATGAIGLATTIWQAGLLRALAWARLDARHTRSAARLRSRIRARARGRQPRRGCGAAARRRLGRLGRHSPGDLLRRDPGRVRGARDHRRRARSASPARPDPAALLARADCAPASWARTAAAADRAVRDRQLRHDAPHPPRHRPAPSPRPHRGHRDSHCRPLVRGHNASASAVALGGG